MKRREFPHCYIKSLLLKTQQPTAMVAMVATDAHVAATTDAPAHHPASLCLSPCEAGGPSMLALKQALVADAAAHEDVPDALGRVLDTLIARNDQRGAGTATLPLFEGSTRCPLKPSAYLRRILKYTNTSPCNVLVGLVYLQRLKDKAEGSIRLTSFNIQRLLLTATMLASKVHDDYFASNKQWALVGDLHLKELNELELEMLFHLQFSLTVTREEYDHRRQELEQLDPARSAARADAQVATGTAGEKHPGCWGAYYSKAAGCKAADTSGSPRSVSSDAAHSMRSTVCGDGDAEALPLEEDAAGQHKVLSMACGPVFCGPLE